MSYNYLSYANLPYWNILPCGMTNFGGDIQVFTLPDDITSGPVGMNLNAQALALLNQQQSIYNNWGVTTPGMVPGVSGGNTGNIFIDNMLNVANRMTAESTQRRISSTLAGIERLRQQMYAQLYKKGITEEEAAKLNDYITKLNEQEEKLLQAQEDAKNGNLSVGDLSKTVAETESAVQNIVGEIQIGQNIKACLKNMEKTFEKIANIEARTDLTAPAKERLAQLKTELEQLKSKLENLQKNPEGLEPAQVNTELTKIATEYNKIINAINQISASSPSTPSSATPGATPSETPGATPSETPGATPSETPGSEPSGTEEPNTHTPSSATPTNSGYSVEGRQLVDLFDEGELEDACSKINSDNVMDVMLAWQDLYATEHEQSFMERFVDEAGYFNKRKYGKIIMNALRDKVLELGIMDECREDFAKINKEVKSTFWFDNDVAKNYDNIIRKIAAKEGRKYVPTPHK